jgi:nitrogen regulatory protein P-II 1
MQQMKMVTAIIQLDRLDAVREALVANEITRITVTRVSGRGQQSPDEDLFRGQRVPLELLPKVRLDIACNDSFVQTVCDSILQAARHGDGAIGDGKIFIMPLEECIRIRTGERGGQAI